MSTARILPHGLPAPELERLHSAHSSLIAARFGHAFATRRCEREVSDAAFAEADAAAATLARAEQEIRAAFLNYGLAVGIVEDAGTVRA